LFDDFFFVQFKRIKVIFLTLLLVSKGRKEEFFEDFLECNRFTFRFCRPFFLDNLLFFPGEHRTPSSHVRPSHLICDDGGANDGGNNIAYFSNRGFHFVGIHRVFLY